VEKRLEHLNLIRENLKRFQYHRKLLFAKDQELPMENLLLKVNHQIAFEFDRVLLDARAIKKSNLQVSEAEELSYEMEKRAQDAYE
jgi:hypothetical protein